LSGNSGKHTYLENSQHCIEKVIKIRSRGWNTFGKPIQMKIRW